MDPIIVVPYDPEWIDYYSNEADILKSVFDDEYMGIMHIGSTSIVGLDAKPIIDIAMGLKSFNTTPYYREKLTPFFYRTDEVFKKCTWILFRKEMPNMTYHLHLMPYDSVRILNQVLFKIYLEDHPQTAKQYVGQKKYFAKYDEDIFYSMNKLPFVTEIEQTAMSALVKEPHYWKNRVYKIMGYHHPTLLVEDQGEKFKIEMAKKMKNDGLKLATIIKYTGLNQEEIEQL